MGTLSLFPSTNIYMTKSRKGRVVYFMAGSLSHAHDVAAQEAGRCYRFVAYIGPSHTLYDEAKKALGIT